MRTVCLIILFTAVSSALYAQNNHRSNDQEIIESIIDNSSNEQDVQLWGEELDYLRSHPIDITRPCYGDLMKLPFVSPMLAESIILFSDTVSIVDVEQLRSVHLMTGLIFDKLLPFIIINHQNADQSSFDLFSSKVETRSRLERRLQTTKGFADNKYLGDAVSSYERVRVKNSTLELAGVFEKDPGELTGDGLLTGYCELKDASALYQCVLGNFTVSSAEGLVFAKNIAASKGNDAVGQIRKRSGGISPAASTDEFGGFYGAAAQLQFNDISLETFYSQRKLPAAIDTGNTVISFYPSGVYRTLSDLRKRNILSEKTVGGIFIFAVENIGSLTMSMMNVRYDHILDRTILDLAGDKSLSAGSISWDIPVYKSKIFGEAATNDAERFSKILGVFLPLSKTLAVSYHHRAYINGYISPYARPFGERSNIGDGERGDYFGIEIKKEKATINAYLEQYILPSTKNEFGSFGRENLVHLSLPINRKFDIVLQIRNKERSQPEIRNTDDDRIQTNYRIAYTYKATRHFSFTNRIEFITVKYKPSQYSENGLLTFLEGSYQNVQAGVRIKSRMIFFETASYDSRLYQYESDVAGNYSNPPMYGKGLRWYVVAGAELFHEFNLSFKYSATKKMNEVVLGSGDDEIVGNVDSRVSLQLDFQF